VSNVPGWFRVPNALLRDHAGEIGAAGIALYCALAMHANKDGACWPSLGTLADLTGLSRRTVIRTIRVLERASLVKVERRVGRTQTNTYRISASLAPFDPEKVPHSHSNGATVAPEKVPHSHSNGATVAPEQDSLNKTQGTRLKNKTHSPARARHHLQISEPQRQAFHRVWDAYPEHRRGAEEDDLAAWVALDPDEALVETMLTAIRTQARGREWREEAGRYVPKFTKWLAERQWDRKAPAYRGGNEYDPARDDG
jgi:hypothetical protein